MAMKQLETVAKTVGDNVFYIRPLPAFKAANLSGEIAGLIMPMLGALTPLLGQDDVMDTDMDTVGSMVTNAFSSLNGESVEKLLRKLILEGKNIAVETPEDEKARPLTEDIANEIFCMSIEDMYILAWEILKVNYGSFFKKLSDRFGPAVKQLMPTATQTSTDMAPSIAVSSASLS